MAASMGSRAALLSSLGQSAAAIAVTAATIASYLPFPFVGNIGDLALYALGEQSGATTAAAMALGIVPGGKLLGKLGLGKAGGFLANLGASAWRSAKYYASNFGRAAVRFAANYSPLGLAQRAWRNMANAGCFEAGTMVWTADGTVPIESIEVGDRVLVQDETTGKSSVRKVLQTFVRTAVPIVAITFTTATAGGETVRTTGEHPFWTNASHWVE